MPTEPVAETLPVTGDPLDAQLLNLFFDRVPMGVAVFGTDKRLQRCNKTWTAFYEHYLGVPPEYTSPGAHMHDLIPGNEAEVDALFDYAFAGQMVRQAAHRIAIPGLETFWDVVFAPLYEDGRVVGVVDIVTDATDRVHSLQRLQARIESFSRIAAGMSLDQPLATTLAEVVTVVRQATTAYACSLICWEGDPDQPPTAYADPVLGDGYADALEGVWYRRRGNPTPPEDYGVTVRRGFRTSALKDPEYEAVHPFFDRMDGEWDDIALVSLVASGEELGQMAVYLRAGHELDEDDRDYLAALADQAAVAVRNASLFRAAEQNAVLVERHRLSRELHDSVSQALFAMTLHARTAQRQLSAAGLPEDHPAATQVTQLHTLTQAALAEMRALIFEVRPGALAEEGLAQALTRQAAATSAREQLPITVKAPTDRVPLPLNVEEHLYRLALEAITNAVKHAHATHIDVRLAAPAEDRLEITITDDGTGFDTDAAHPGHLGMTTMRDRAAAAGARMNIISAPGAGTTVRVTVPLADTANA
jgi:signal transduction histidine kinase